MDGEVRPFDEFAMGNVFTSKPCYTFGASMTFRDLDPRALG